MPSKDFSADIWKIFCWRLLPGKLSKKKTYLLANLLMIQWPVLGEILFSLMTPNKSLHRVFEVLHIVPPGQREKRAYDKIIKSVVYNLFLTSLSRTELVCCWKAFHLTHAKERERKALYLLEKTLTRRMLWIIEKLCKSQSLIFLLPSFPSHGESHNQ